MENVQGRKVRFVRLTDLTLSCAAGPRAEAGAARRLPRMTFAEPSRDLQPP